MSIPGKPNLPAVVLLTLLSLPAALAAQEADDTSRLIAALASEEQAARDEAMEALAARGASAVAPLVDAIAGENTTAAAGARAALRLLAHRAAAPSHPADAPASPAAADGTGAASKDGPERGAVTRALIAEVDTSSRPLTVRRWLLRLAGFTASDGAVPFLAARLADPDLGDMALFALRRIPGTKAHDALRRALAEGAPEGRPALILALGDRRSPADGEAIRSFADSDDGATRLAAFGALGRIPDARSAGILWNASCTAPGPEGPAARAAFLNLAHTLLDAGRDDEAARLFNRIHVEAEAPHFRCAGLLGLVAAQPENAIPVLLDAVTADPDEVTGAAVQALARMPGEEITLAMANAVATAGDRSRIRLIHALGARRDSAAEEATRKIVAFLDTAADSAKVAVLDALADREDASLAPHFRKAARSECGEVVAAAAGALGRLRDPAFAPFLLEIAGAGCDAENSAALQGCLLIADAMASRDGKGALELCREVLRLAHADPERESAIGRLSRLGDPGALPDLAPYLAGGPSGLRRAAARAAAPLATRLVTNPDTSDGEKTKALGLLEEIVRLAEHADTVRDAATTLRAHGVEVDLPVPAGFVKHFHVIGPFPGRERLLETDLLAVTEPVALDGTVRDGDRTFRWKYFPPENLDGMLDLLRAVAPSNDAGAYVLATITVADACDAILRIGSDDDVFCRLNGELVHTFTGGRGWGPDQDAVPVRLRKGANQILFKVLNGGGGWAVSLKITDGAGHPLPFAEEKP